MANTARTTAPARPLTHDQRMVKFFTTPASYPHAVAKIQRRETHVSHVFLAGPCVYKLKKAVHFPFLDASTLALRRKWCRLELQLNRRLAPTLYIGMVPVVETASGLRLGGRRPSGRRHFLASADGPDQGGRGRNV